MTKKILALLVAPLILFAEIEVATSKAAPKEIVKTEKTTEISQKVEQKKTGSLSPKQVQIDDGEMKPEATTPNFIDPNYQKQFFRTLIFICVLILGAMIIVFIYKRASPMSVISKKNGRGNIKILERRSLSPQTYLYMVEIGGKQFILSESKVDVRNVQNLDWPE
jgi:flagellar biogenesis protein FliO